MIQQHVVFKRNGLHGLPFSFRTRSGQFLFVIICRDISNQPTQQGANYDNKVTTFSRNDISFPPKLNLMTSSCINCNVFTCLDLTPVTSYYISCTQCSMTYGGIITCTSQMCYPLGLSKLQTQVFQVSKNHPQKSSFTPQKSNFTQVLIRYIRNHMTKFIQVSCKLCALFSLTAEIQTSI